MKRVLLTVILILYFLIQGSISYCEYHWHFITSTPQIKGKVIDSDTGEPIKNTILVVQWLKAIPGIVDTSSAVIAEKGYATNDKGEFSIPKKINIHFRSYFMGVLIGVVNPYYSIVNTGISCRDVSKITYIDSEYKNGIIKTTIKMTKLENKYKIPADNIILLSEFGNNSYSLYFKWARKLGIEVDKDAIFQNWDRIINRYPEDEKYLFLNNYTKKLKSKINEAERDE